MRSLFNILLCALFCLTLYSNFSMSASAHHANDAHMSQSDHGHSHNDWDAPQKLDNHAHSLVKQYGDSHDQSHEQFGADHHQTMALPLGQNKPLLTPHGKAGPCWQQNAWSNCLYFPDRPPSI